MLSKASFRFRRIALISQTIKLYNTLSGQIEIFKPIKEDHVGIYVCGVTVYDYCHMGHARAYVAFDTIRRYLEHIGYDVTYIQNFTDIDDKIINRAQQRKISTDTLTKETIQAYFEDMDQLNIKRAAKYPKATENMSQIFKLIKTLIQKDVAYEVNGEVFFDISKARNYGKLSGKIVEELQAGKRVDVTDNKRNPLDFVLWKPAKESEPFWNSPWGKGRPGWHIECSAMAMQELGETIDIHGGGQDLMFPHHENEICQSECATDKTFVNYWLHNGFVNINNEKMSKSLGNFFTLRECLKKYKGQVIRFFLQKMHYRSPLNFSLEGIEEAESALKKLKTCVENNPGPVQQEHYEEMNQLKEKFYNAMNEDMNYAEAIGVLFEMAKSINIHKSGANILIDFAGILGLSLAPDNSNIDEEQVLKWIEKRTKAKSDKDYKEADRIRGLLQNELGVILEDTPEGVRWKKKAN